jgi:hypothetical protein
MKKIIFILVIISFWGVSFSQNDHFQFGLDSASTSNSAITIVHKSKIAYLIQTESNNIHISNIDPVDMQPLGTTFSYNFPPFKYIFLNGGYEDFQGNLIAYGYTTNLDGYLIVKIDLGIDSMSVSYAYGPGIEIVEGCCGYDENKNICNLFLLSKINNLNINNEVIAYNDSLMPCTAQSFQSSFGTITDISWDSYHDLFIASGSTPTNRIDPFLIYFRCGTIYSNFFNLVDTIIISNQHFFQGAEGRTLHEVIDELHLILIHDLRDSSSDYIWVIQVENIPLNLSVLNSKIFRLPQPKLILQDMKYDSHSNKLTILGRNVLCVDGINIIAQMDPYSLTNFKIAQIMDQNSYSSCTVGPPANIIYGNEIYLQRLEINPFNSCRTILSTGINGNVGAYITETYDIGNSNCDQPFPTTEYSLSFFYPYPTPSAAYSNYYYNHDSTTIIPSPILTQSIKCGYVTYCDKGSIETNVDNQLTKLIPSISLHSCEFFECSHFSETVYYYLYDLAGKILYQGRTENGIKTLLPNLSNGIYILSVADDIGNKKSKKVFYFK